MSRYRAFPMAATTLVVCMLSTLSTAHAASDPTGQVLILSPSSDESSMRVLWQTGDDFGPSLPCNQRSYSLDVKIDGAVVQRFSSSNYPLSRHINGNCYLDQPIYTGEQKVPPGVWFATARNPAGTPLITETKTIHACTLKQGKQPMYWTINSQYTDNFYTTSINDRNMSLSMGYSNAGVPFSMPMPTRFGSVPFYRYFKGAPQLEHFYTHDYSEWQFVEQNGYVYEGVEGYAFNNFKPGTVALWRYALFDGSTGDLMHYYTINPNDPSAAGWSYDGLAGYVCAP
jgi:Repeat of unknown function (DUF5648)